MSRIEQIRQIVTDKQSATIDGMLVDGVTASAIVACFDAGSDQTKETIETAPLDRVGELALRLTRRAG